MRPVVLWSTVMRELLAWSSSYVVQSVVTELNATDMDAYTKTVLKICIS